MNIAQRFAHIEQSYDFQPLKGAETFPVDELPLFIRLGRNALDTLVVVNPAVDLDDAERRSGGVSLNTDVSTVLIDPTIYNIAQKVGYKGIHAGQAVVLGRSSKNNIHRLRPFTEGVSRYHASVSASEDGQSVTIRDLDSLNGTFIGKLPVNLEQLDTTTSTEEKTSLLERLHHVSSEGSSLPSDRHPDRNEDTFITYDDHNVYGVLDGVGGFFGGDVASRVGRDHIYEHAYPIDTFESLSDASQYLQDLLSGAHETIYAETKEAATTAVLAKVHVFSDELYISVAHVGDSRAYLLRDGTLKALTTDHTPYRKDFGTKDAMIQQEKLADTDTISILSPDEIRQFRRRNIIGECLGRGEPFKADINHFVVQEGDVIVLSSDGVHDNLTTPEILKILMNTQNSDAAERLTEAARERARQSHLRAKMDDITAVVITI